MDPDMALGADQATQINMIPIGSMALGYQHGLRWLTIPQVSTRPYVVTGTMGIKSGHGYCRATDLDMAFGSCPGPDNTRAPGGGLWQQLGPGVTMTLGGSAGYSDKYGTAGA